MHFICKVLMWAINGLMGNLKVVRVIAQPKIACKSTIGEFATFERDP